MFSQRRLIGLVLAVLLHVLAIYGLVSGLARAVVERVMAPIETEIIEEQQVEEEPPPPPPPDLPPPPPVVLPPPVVVVETTMAPPTNVITVSPPRPTPPPPAPPPPVREPLCEKPKERGGRKQPPPYPSTSKRLGEEGSADLEFTVAADGSVNDEGISVVRSSGFPRLDDAAIRFIRRYRFQPGKCDGVAQEMKHVYRVTFRLEDA